MTSDNGTIALPSNTLSLNRVAVKHGGDLDAASRKFGIAEGQWLDLSTGISPWSWPVPAIPESVWRRLPGSGSALQQAAADYYGCAPGAVLPVAGSQIAIQQLPQLFTGAVVAIPNRGYAEHRHAWRQAGHRVRLYGSTGQLQQWVSQGEVSHAVVINPNNPTAGLLGREPLLALHRTLAGRGGVLLVDEAFMDVTPQHSLAPLCPLPGLVVLRSVGKFFGLAGIRLGFALATPALLASLKERLSPWMVSHPADWLGARALRDRDWQGLQVARLQQQSARWLRALQQQLPELTFSATALFASGFGDAELCRQCHGALARQGVWVRIFEPDQGRNALRFGLPAGGDMARAVAALERVTER